VNRKDGRVLVGQTQWGLSCCVHIVDKIFKSVEIAWT